MGRVIGRLIRLLLIIILVLTAAFFLFRRKYQDVIVALAQTQVINTTCHRPANCHRRHYVRPDCVL